MTVNGRYDPNHPDADWSGYVATVPSKKHIEAPPSQLTSHDMGIAPNEEAKTSEWKQARRITSSSKGNATFDLIGGPEDEWQVNPSHWQTEAQSAASNEKKTTIDQLTETGRSMHVRGKKSSTPAYENTFPFSDSVASQLRDENPYLLNEDKCVYKNSWNKTSKIFTIGDKENLIGYRAPRAGESFLAGLGKELTAEKYPE